MCKLTQNSLRGAALRLEIEEGDIARTNRMKAKGTRLRSTQGFPGLGNLGQMPRVLESNGVLAQALAGSPVMGV